MDIEQSVEAEMAGMETTECEYCGKECLRAATVDIVAGKKIGKWTKSRSTPAHYGVTSTHTERGFPHIEEWCYSCAEAEFQIADNNVNRMEIVESWLSAKNIISFCLGIIITLLPVLVF